MIELTDTQLIGVVILYAIVTTAAICNFLEKYKEYKNK